MNMQTLVDHETFETVLAPQDATTSLVSAYTSDLLSDVMANAHEADILITIQAHNNTVAVASLAGVSAIIICNNRPIPSDMIDSARNEDIAIFKTHANQFGTSCLIGNLLAS